jgi:hypothetical protein
VTDGIAAAVRAPAVAVAFAGVRAAAATIR